MKSTLRMIVLTAAALPTLCLSAGISFGASEVVTADPDAKVEYSGTLSILTKFGLQQLSPYFVDRAQE